MKNTKNIKKLSPAWLAVLVLGLMCSFLLCSCAKKKGNAAAENGKIKIAATIFPLADIAKNIGGDKVTVITIMPPGASPHTFEVSPETVESAEGTAILFKIGEGLDDWVSGITGAMGKKPSVVAVSKGITLKKFPDGTVDPHYWLNLENGMIIARTIAACLCDHNPADKAYYDKNLTDYLGRLSKADEELKKMFENLPDKKFVTFHEAWFYFASAYGLEVAAAFEPFPGKEPTPEFLAEFTNTIKRNNVKVLFTEPQFSADAVRQLAKDIGIRFEVLDPLGGTSEKTDSYILMMKSNADTIYKALSSQ